jgi:hypothetical protein
MRCPNRDGARIWQPAGCDKATPPRGESRMVWLPTVVLHHRTTAGSHHDWLLADPEEPLGLLWAGRIPAPPRSWAAVGTWPVHPLPPHRRRYLTYQGPLTGGRGVVRRCAAGLHRPLRWSATRRWLVVRFPGCRGRVLLERWGGGLWRARWDGAVDDEGPVPASPPRWRPCRPPGRAGAGGIVAPTDRISSGGSIRSSSSLP